MAQGDGESGGKAYSREAISGCPDRVSGSLMMLFLSCDEYYLEHPKELLMLLPEALKILWSVDISDCPRNRDERFFI